MPEPTTVDDTALIAIDWGTSAARAYRVDRAGHTLDSRAAPLGVQHVRDGDFASALATLLGDWSALPVPRLAAGMIGSRQGWREAPYLACPASVDALAGGLVDVPGDAMRIVPGLTTRDAAGVPDVMRGEETQLAGAIAPTEGSVLAVLPGTHSKWARVEHGVIVDFQTYMTGELFGALLDHTILGRLAQRDAAPADPGAFAAGVARGLGAGGLLHDVFGARTLALMNELAPADVPEWLSGLLIGREIRNARTWAFRAGHDASHVRVIGSDALTARYTRALDAADVAAESGPGDAAVRGLWRIARQSGVLS